DHVLLHLLTLLLFYYSSLLTYLLFFFLMIRPPPRSTLFPTRRSSDLTPYEILLSESQERMLIIAKRGKENIVREIFFAALGDDRSEEHTSELQSRGHLVCRLLLEKKKEEKVIVRVVYKKN